MDKEFRKGHLPISILYVVYLESCLIEPEGVQKLYILKEVLSNFAIEREDITWLSFCWALI